MEKKVSFRPYITLGLLFLGTLLLLIFTVNVKEVRVAGIRTELPGQLSSQWIGHDVLFCQKMTCGRSWLLKDLPENPNGDLICPETLRGKDCGGNLLAKSLGEALALPEDTVIIKKQYINPSDPLDTVFASVVLSGQDRSSIHRPEICMPAQGNRIVLSEAIDIPLPGREPLTVMVLNLTQGKDSERQRHSYYAYWFVGSSGRETPHHMQRILWMATDRIFHNVSHRWAYIAVNGSRSPDLLNKDHHDEIRSVIGSLYPELALPATPDA